MLHQLKHKLDLYFDSTISVANQMVNNPRAGGPVSAYLLGMGLVEFNDVLQLMCTILGLIVGGFALWAAIGNKAYNHKKRKMEDKISELKVKNLTLKNGTLEAEKAALEDHIKRPKSPL